MEAHGVWIAVNSRTISLLLVVYIIGTCLHRHNLDRTTPGRGPHDVCDVLEVGEEEVRVVGNADYAFVANAPTERRATRELCGREGGSGVESDTGWTE